MATPVPAANERIGDLLVREGLISKEQLEKAPGFDKEHWPSMADQSWAAAVHTYYHVKPYWEDTRRSGPDLRASATGAMPPRY